MSFFRHGKNNNVENYKKNKTQPRYQLNLVNLMTLCANNYMLLLKVIANKSEVNQTRHFFISDALAYTVTIVEVTRYTSLITIEQNAIEHGATESTINTGLTNTDLAKLLRPKMMIRLYHDARMAEVISSQDVKQIKPRYSYPNNDMHQQDEKQQTNQFLNEWLHLCLDMGQVALALSR